jgi:hypothetical protein
LMGNSKCKLQIRREAEDLGNQELLQYRIPSRVQHCTVPQQYPTLSRRIAVAGN